MSNDKKNSLWLAIQYSASLIIAFFTLKLNIVHYGNELFGMWIVIASLWGIGSALDFGFATGIVKYVAEAKSTDDYKRINTLISSGFIVFFLTGVVIVLAGYTGGYFIFIRNPKIVSEANKTVAWFILVILGINFYFQYLFLFFKAVWEGLSNFVWSSKLTLLYNVIVLLIVIVVSALKLSMVILSAGYCLASLVLISVNVYLMRNNEKIRISPSHFHFKTVKHLMKFSASIQLASLFNSLIDPAIKYILGNYSSLSLVSFFEIARKFSVAISGLFFATFRTILPKASTLKSKGEYQEFLYTEGVRVLKMSIIYSGFAVGVCSIVIASVMKLWFGFSELILIFMILSIPEAINCFGYTFYIFLIGIGKPQFIAFVQFVNIIIVAISLIMGFYLFNSSLGLFGYYLTIVVVNILMVWFVKKQTLISVRFLFRQVDFKKLLYLNILVLAAIVLIYRQSTYSYAVLAFVSVISLGIFFTDLRKYTKVFKNLAKAKLV